MSDKLHIHTKVKGEEYDPAPARTLCGELYSEVGRCCTHQDSILRNFPPEQYCVECLAQYGGYPKGHHA